MFPQMTPIDDLFNCTISTQRWILARMRKDEDIGVMPTTNTLIRPMFNLGVFFFLSVYAYLVT